MILLRVQIPFNIVDNPSLKLTQAIPVRVVMAVAMKTVQDWACLATVVCLLMVWLFVVWLLMVWPLVAWLLVVWLLVVWPLVVWFMLLSMLHVGGDRVGMLGCAVAVIE